MKKTTKLFYRLLTLVLMIVTIMSLTATSAFAATVKAPAVPKKLSVNMRYVGAIGVSWDASSGASYYQVKYASSKEGLSDSKKPRTVNNIKGKSTIITDLSDGTYYVQVRACAKSGKSTAWSGWSEVKSVSILSKRASLDARIKKFSNDSRWKEGVYFGGNTGPKVAANKGIQCYAYALDFIKFVYNVDSFGAGKKFTSASDIRKGDVIHGTPNHWMVVTGRSGNKISVIHGNWTNGKVCKNTFTLSGKKIMNGNRLVKTFDVGYHYN